MTGARPAEILRQLEQTETDTGLLARFVATKDGAAFAELVRRHAALVLGLCRRVTGHSEDAEDAFQATFLVLAQKAATLQNATLLGNWLHGVAFRVASRAKRSARRRRAREVTVAVLPESPAPPNTPHAPELLSVLDEELARLSACYRDAIVLCDLRGTPRAEAAFALGVPEGTLSSRLANGRKKLAARLTRRGVALSAAALPIAVAEGPAATGVRIELVTKTCGLIAGWATGGAVPHSVAQLTQGGSAVRKSLILGAAMAVGLAGAVFATSSQKEPPTDPPMPPLVAAKPAEQPLPKQEPKKGENAVAFTTAPKLRRWFDVPLDSGQLKAMWNANGSHLAVLGWRAAALPGGKPHTAAVICALASQFPSAPILDDGTELVGFAPDGLTYVTALREHNLISGRHQLSFSNVLETQAGPGLVNIHLKSTETVDLDLPETRGYVFSADMKTFRTVALKKSSDGEATEREVLEVNARRGKSVKSLLTFRSETYAMSANGQRFAVLDQNASQVTVFDLDRGVKLFDCPFPKDPKDKEPPGSERYLVFSPDGRRLAVSCGQGRLYLVDADTGKVMPRLEGTTYCNAELLVGACFSADGRLLAASGVSYKQTVTEPKRASPAWQATGASTPLSSLPPPDTGVLPDGRRMTEPKGDIPAQRSIKFDGLFSTVWDTQTGKALKTWKNYSEFTFCPTRPVLAILEKNGEFNTRVGFWDFAAEVEKK